ncbi:MAG: L-threonylcarbamoyladenylate synthase [Pirellula sp.]
MKTRHLSVSPADLAIAAALLNQGELVAFPTETVYGLGANAMNPYAIDKVYTAKGRPSDNPLIVHVASCDAVLTVAREVNLLAKNLMNRFWPGPLTLVLPKRDEVPASVTAGLSTVAVRLPEHVIARELIRLANCPVAAPSANRSGRPSATTWEAVAEDLDGRIAAIVHGEPTHIGLESTVVDTTSTPPRVLRPGGISFDAIQELVPNLVPYRSTTDLESQAQHNSPGLRHQHYRPRAKVVVVDNLSDGLPSASLTMTPQKNFYIGIHSPPWKDELHSVFICRNVDEYAAKLFDCFRQADLAHATTILCESVSDDGIGAALMDRLRRAAHID